jgi:integrase
MKFQKYFDKKLKGDYWRFDLTIGGQRYRHGGFIHKKDAEAAAAALRVFAQRTAYGLPVDIPERTLADLSAKLAADKTISRQIRRMLQMFAQHCGEQTPLRQLSRADIKSFADHLREQKTLADSSFSLYLAQLKTALYRAGDYFAELETWQPPRLPRLPGFRKRTQTVTQAEIGAFLVELSKPVWHADRASSRKFRRDLADIIRLMCLLGARREEIEQITWGKIDWERRTLLLWSSKTKREHLVPLSELAILVLKQRQPLKSDRLFSDKLRSCDITHTMTKAARQLGMTYGRAGWTLHDLRRTAAVLVENAGLPYSAVQDLLGHKRQDITSTYTPGQLGTLRQAVQVLETWCREIDSFLGDTRDLQRPLETSHKSHAA